LAVTWIGVVNSACCQPDEVSLTNVTVPSSAPAADQRAPVCVPVFERPL
jgi:hypothetical protein